MENEYRRAFCPHCGRELLLPLNAESLVCMYCAEPINTGAPPREDAREDPALLLCEAERLLPEGVFDRHFLNDDRHFLNGDCHSSKELNAKTYPSLFRAYTASMAAAFAVYRRAAGINEDQAARDFAERLLRRLEEQFQEERIRKESDPRLFDYRYTMVSLLIPAMLEEGRAGARLADHFLALWNGKHPKNPLGRADYKSICEGFRKKPCYITTAVCLSLGHGEDCSELQAFRAFRDGWLRGSSDGERKIAEYYAFAPLIVAGIDAGPRPREAYRTIWRRCLALCLRDLRAGRPAECARRYEAMMRDLERHYL